MKRIGILFGLVILHGGCAKPLVVVPSGDGETVIKPVKMPPRVNPLGEVKSIEIEEFFTLQQSGGALIYDVRKPYFFGIDRIPGAINLPHDDYEGHVQKNDVEIQKALKAGKKVVLYCFNTTCPEARDVARKLARRDYVIHVFYQGIDTWRAAGLPLEAGVAAP